MPNLVKKLVKTKAKTHCALTHGALCT